MKTKKKNQKKIRYAVVGIGFISQDAVLPAFKNCKHAELAALVSGDPKKLKTLGRKYRVPHLYSYEQYEECLRSGNIDAVYIALPNYMHREYTEKAAEAKIHVICEKPMAVTSEECHAMIRATQQNQVKLMIAYRLHLEAANLKAIQMIHKKRSIGEPRLFQSMHSQPTAHPNIRTEPISTGGGPTYDIGIYDINASRYLFRDEPISVFAQSANSGKEPYEKIEEAMSIILKFPGEKLASILYSFGGVATDHCRVTGTQGDLVIEPPYAYEGKKTIRLTRKSKTHVEKFPARDHFGPVLDYFADCILNDKKVEPSGVEGLIDVMIIEAIHRSAQTGQPIPLDLPNKEKWADEEQKIEMPAVETPKKLVDAQKPVQEEAA